MATFSRVFVVLVQEISDEYAAVTPPYVQAVFEENGHAQTAAQRYLRDHPHGWAEVQSFYVV